MGATTDLDDAAIRAAATLIQRSRHVAALVGAGLSAESGVPTFRGDGGLWTRFGEPTFDGWELFNSDPGAWWDDALAAQHRDSEFARALDSARPNAGHVAMAEMEQMGRLAHTITQNIDDLQHRAGCRKLTEIHGNRYLVRCMNCGGRDRLSTISLDRLPPLCPECGGTLKTDTVMFGEPIPEDALRECYRQAALADLFLVVGTSAVVYPAAEFPVMAKRRGAALIEINPEETDLTPLADIVVRAAAGAALAAIVDELRAETMA
ncbi:MAG: NAD-dependent protein deacylase [Chloroflexi bacterium]|nr:NAD-dependent protein deacylase [Chloroflexota bacterium]